MTTQLIDKPKENPQEIPVEKPTLEFVRKVNRQSRVFTGFALAVCTVIYFAIDAWVGHDAVVAQARFNTVFQTMLVACWCFYMLPYFRTTLQTVLWGVSINDKLAKTFESIEGKVDEKFNELKVDLRKELGTLRSEVARVGDSFERPIVSPPTGPIRAPELEKVKDGAERKGNGSP